MRKSEKIKLKGRELATRLTGILTHMGGISWKPLADEQDKARRLLVYLAGQRALHYPYDRERSAPSSCSPSSIPVSDLPATSRLSLWTLF